MTRAYALDLARRAFLIAMLAFFLLPFLWLATTA